LIFFFCLWLNCYEIFPDLGLAQAVAQELGVWAEGSIEISELAEITYLDAEDAGIEDLTGIGYLTNLEELNLGENQISNLAPGTFTDLTSLTSLILTNNQISDLAPGTFAGLESLMILSLWSNQISDLTTGAFAGLENLTNLYLDNNKIRDLALDTFTNLTNLRTLSLSENQIRDLASIANLTNLEGLSLWVNQISDLRPLEKLNLDWLDVADQTIHLPATTIGATTTLYLYLPDGTEVALWSTNGQLTFDNNQLTWQTPGYNSATWNNEMDGTVYFNETIYQTVAPARQITENHDQDQSLEIPESEADGNLPDKSPENPTSYPDEISEDEEIKEVPNNNEDELFLKEDELHLLPKNQQRVQVE